MDTLSIKTAKTAGDYDLFYKIYTDAFKNEPDEIYSKEEILDWFFESKKKFPVDIYLLLLNQIVVGFIYLMHKDGIAHIAWAGMATEFQGKGLYPKFIKLFTQTILKEAGIYIIVRECDNPEVLSGKLKKYALKRLGIFRDKLGTQFVTNKEYIYFNPQLQKQKKSYYKYLFGFSIINPNGPIKILGNQIKREDFQKLVEYVHYFESGFFERDGESNDAEIVREFYKRVEDLNIECLSVE